MTTNTVCPSTDLEQASVVFGREQRLVMYVPLLHTMEREDTLAKHVHFT